MPFLWIRRLCEAFWHHANLDEPYPRNLRSAIRRAVPLSVVELSQLSTDTIVAHLRTQRLSLLPPKMPSRLLRGCLLAYRGAGLIFLDRDDPDDEKRFSLAHELGHFLRHYLQPRQEAERRLGASILEVLDGQRSATTSERFHSLLREVTIGCHVHMMDRTATGSASLEVQRHEEEADLVAYHLLAPREAVLAETDDRANVVDLLRSRFGLPVRQAEKYAEVLFPVAEVDPLLRSLKLSRDFVSKMPPSSGTPREEQR